MVLIFLFQLQPLLLGTPAVEMQPLVGPSSGHQDASCGSLMSREAGKSLLRCSLRLQIVFGASIAVLML